MPVIQPQKNRLADAIGHEAPDISCCAVILAGGMNTRMNGRNKAFLEIGNKTILDRMLQTLKPIFREILLVTRLPHLYSEYPVRVVSDIFEDRSSLTGIHAGLTHAGAEFAFVVPCDAPFLKAGLVRLLLNELKPAVDVVVPFFDGHYQPLCAIYSKRCAPVIEAQLTNRIYKVIEIFDQMNVKILSRDRIVAVDPEMASFINVNTPEAYEVCRKIKDPLSNPKE